MTEKDRIIGEAIDSKARIASLEKTTERIEKSIDKLVFEISSLRAEISSLRTDLPRKMTTASAIGGSIAGVLAIGALLVQHFLGSS